MNKKGKLIWITGLPASGKTTIAETLYKRIKKRQPNIVHLDGDHMRSIWGIWNEKDPERRRKMAMSYAKQCNLLTNQGIWVIMSTVSLFHEVHDYNRKNNPNYYEILIKTEQTLLDKRKKENCLSLNDKERWDEPIHEFPKNPDLILENNVTTQIEKNVRKILELIYS